MISEKDMSKLLVRLRPEQLDRLEWEEGEDLEIDIQGRNLVLKPKDKD